MFLSRLAAFTLFLFIHPRVFTFAADVDDICYTFSSFDGLADLNPPSKAQQLIGLGNGIATVVIFLLVVLNVIFYYLRLHWEASFGFERNKKLLLSSLEQRFRQFSLAEIRTATRNFDDELVVGRGGFGKVYKGVVDVVGDGMETTVAIKRLNPDSKQGALEFQTEIEMLSKFRHINLVSLVGYCDDYPEMVLVYEFMAHGTLSDHLYHRTTTRSSSSSNGGRSSSSSPPALLSWKQLLRICIGAARGLDYLHTGTGARHRIIHRDVKSSNILLDENWVAKISDFGLSKIGPANQSCTQVSTNVKGTFGYLDPEYFMTRRLTRKSDVYAFGVVLFEVLCGRPALDFGLNDEQHSLAQWARHCVEQGSIQEMIDRRLSGQISPSCLKSFVEIADKCLQNHPDRRPSMADIVARLEFALASQASTDSSTENVKEDTSIGGVYDNQENMNSSTEDEDLGNVADQERKIDEEIKRLGDAGCSQTHGQPRVVPSRGKIKRNSLLQLIGSVVSKGRRREPIWRRKKNHPGSSNVPLPADVHCRRFFLDEIQGATHSFHADFIIGLGLYSMIYKGYIGGGHMMVAIKRFDTAERWSHELFYNEITVHSSIGDHLHIVSLIGYCNDGSEMILVYEYISNGSLRDHLFGNSDSLLSWKQRLQICIRTARGLKHLHTARGPGETYIIHRNLTSNSILLDGNWVPKVSGLGLSMLVPNDLFLSTTGISCPTGYLDPQFLYHGRPSAKSDVDSFGVVLMEVLCAKHPGKMMSGDSLPSLVWKSIQERTLDQIIDTYLIVGNQIAPECLSEYLKIALRCLVHAVMNRPSMGDVLEGLEYALQMQVKAEASEEISVRRGDGFTMENVYQEISLLCPPSDFLFLYGCKGDSQMSVPIVDCQMSVPSFDFDSMELNR